MALRAIIIDDEHNSRDALKLVIERYCPDVTVVASAKSAMDGIEQIEKHQPDLIFLDIQMPGMSGFDMLSKIGKANFHVIFTTAYNQYAIKAIRFSAMDYLLKPIDIDDLQHAIQRVLEAGPANSNQVEAVVKNMHPQKEKLAVPSSDGISFIDLPEVLYLEAEGNYTNIVLENGEVLLVSKTLKEFDELLSEDGFFRIHKSSLIQLKHIKKYVRGDGGHVVMNNSKTLTVSRRKKEEFLRALALL